MSLNVSKRQLERPDFVKEVEQALSELGLDPRSIHLEIAETVLMEGGSPIESRLDELHGLGTYLEIDDFGTGHSSLGRLHRLPLSGLKIDRSLVSRLCDTKSSVEMIRAVVAFAGGLRMGITAEGVESHEERRALRELGCARAQGYLFGRPADATATGAMLRARCLTPTAR
jgi:EAL domain-containing protein (putative c-di-GMP-specific phosphodiesterase class I)